MNIIIVGLGSMGKRRIRLLKKYFKCNMLVGVDSRLDRVNDCKNEYDITCYQTLNEAFMDNIFDCAFICTSPLSHSSIIKECLLRKINVFSELNLTKDGYEENLNLAKANQSVLFLSSTALYRKEMKYIINKIQGTEGTVNYTYHVGQFLPDWHPWESIDDFFVSNIKSNGCREILAIELPWLIKGFGKIKDIKVTSNKSSNLNINYNDNYAILLTHEDGSCGVLVVDVLCREAVRNLLVYGQDLFIRWDGTPDSLWEKDINNNVMEHKFLYDTIDKLSGYSSNIIENHYIDEIKEFFNVLAGNSSIEYGFREDGYILDIIDTIEEKIYNQDKKNG